jgi:hypothetical protein
MDLYGSGASSGSVSQVLYTPYMYIYMYIVKVQSTETNPEPSFGRIYGLWPMRFLISDSTVIDTLCGTWVFPSSVRRKNWKLSL